MSIVTNGGFVFPKTPRVIYAKNPLKEVICQLRFPVILKIGEDPVEFQERIRKRFPVFEVKNPLTDDMSKEVLSFLGAQSPLGSGASTYHFRTEDENWTVALTRDFVALSTSRYEHWGAFFEKLQTALQALQDVYRPAFFTRIGLRYKDLICRSALGLRAEWRELLKPHITAELGIEELCERVQKKKTEIVIDLGSGDRVRIVHGLIGQPGSDEPCYLVDSDFFTTEKVGTDDAINKLAAFNKQAGDLFRWCIAEKLHRAMEPQIP